MARDRGEKSGEVRRLAAIMFTDMVGFTALAQGDEPKAMRLLERQRGIMRPLFAEHGGREVKTIGDAFLVEFASSLEAVRCAAEIQSALAKESAARPAGDGIVVRIGVHLGDVIVNGTDIGGDAVNVASRIEPLADPGGVCVTRQVYDSVYNKAPYRFESVGSPALKNVASPMEVFRMSLTPHVRPPPASGTAPRGDRIAVLPFANMSTDRGDEYLADGMTDEVISAVSRVQGVRVIARTSVMRYKSTGRSVSEIGRELGVGSVLEGSVRRSGNRLRVTVKLADALSEESRWAADYDRTLEDVLAIQSDIASKVAAALRVQILGGGAGALATPTANPEAYLLYLRGRQELGRRTRGSLEEAVGLFERSLRVDAGFAKAHSGLADSYAALALLEFLPPADAFPKASSAVDRALSLDPGLAEAHASLGLVRFQYEWDWQSAEGELTEAIALSPSYASSHHFLADYLKAMGRFDEALAEIRKAQELDPLSLVISAGVGHVLYLSRRFDAAIEQYRKAVDLAPDFMQTHVWFGRPYLEKGMYKEAIAELESGVKLSGGSTLALGMLGHGLASAGDDARAKDVLSRLMERSKREYVSPYWIAAVYNGFRDRDNTIAWLKRAYEERSSWLVWANVEPRFDWLRDDGDFRELVKAMRFP